MSNSNPNVNRAQFSRRQIMAGMGTVGLSAFLAACSSGGKDAVTSGSQSSTSSSSSAPESSSSSLSSDSSAPTSSSDTSSSSAAPKPLRKMSFNLGFLPLPQYAGFYYGVDQGIYADHGVDLTINSSNGTATAISQLFSGQDQCVFVPASALLQAYADDLGNPAAKTYATLIIQDTSSIFFYKDSGIVAPKDLEGQTIVTSAGSNEFREFPDFAAANGVDAAKVKWQNVDSSLKVSLLTSNQAKVTSTALYSLAQIEGQTKDGREIGYFCYGNLGVPGVGSGLVMTDDFVKENGELAKDFIQASMVANLAAYNDPDAAANAMLKAVPALDMSIAGRMLEIVKSVSLGPDQEKNGLGFTNDEAYKATYDRVAAAGVDLGRPYNEYFTNDFIVAP